MSNAIVVLDPETGELIEREVSTFDNGGRGEVPTFKKEDLNGKTVIIAGISDEPEEFELGPVRFLMLYREGDDPRGEPWGVMVHASSPIVGQVENQVRRGRAPFAARMERVPSKSHKGYSYWRLTKPDAKVVNAA